MAERLIVCDQISDSIWLANARGYGSKFGTASGRTREEAVSRLTALAARMNLHPDQLIDDNLRRLVADIACSAPDQIDEIE